MKRKLTRAQAVQRAATIRKQNVQRHEASASNSRLREEIQRKFANENRRVEMGNLLEHSIRGNGLDQMALARLNQLQGMVR